jgi:NADH dehydrogenase
MQSLVIIGGGFAGFWTAVSAARQSRTLARRSDLNIILLSLNEYLSIRPRFYENRFDDMRVLMKKYFEPLGIDLRIGKTVGIDTDQRTVLSVDSEGKEANLSYDGLVLASGSRVKRPGIPGFDHTLNVDTFDNAIALERHLQKLSSSGFPSSSSRTFVVVGASFTGIEVVTKLLERLRSLAPDENRFNLVLSDHSFTIAPGYSMEGREIIRQDLERNGVRLLLGEEVAAIDHDRIFFKSGQSLQTMTVIWCGGLEASPLTGEFGGVRDALGRLPVDRFLRIEGHGVHFAAGDVARAYVDEENLSVMSCQHAVPQGKLAGHNAVNALFDKDLVAYLQPDYRTCLDLGPGNALLTSGWERTPRGSGKDAKAVKEEIVTQWIVPDPDFKETLRKSDPFLGPW